MSPFRASRSVPGDSLRSLRAFDAIFHNMRFHTGMSCYLVTAKERDQWICLQSDLSHFGIKDFEALFGGHQERFHYNQAVFERLVKRKRMVRSRLSGFHDLFVPVLKEGKCLAFIISGLFTKTIPTRQELEDQWLRWTGKKPTPEDLRFKRFVRTALNLSLLDGPQAQAHEELLGMVAALVSGEADPDRITDRAMLLNHKVFTRWTLRKGWPERALGLESPGTDRVWPDRRLNEEDRIATRMRRVPTLAIVLHPADPPDLPIDEVDAMLRQRHLERAGFFETQRLEEAVCFPLRGEGLVLLTSPKPGSSPQQARLQAKEKARDLADRLERKLKVRLRVGIGPAVPEGEGLYPSYQGAVLALQWAVRQDKKILLFDEIPASGPSLVPSTGPRPDALALVKVLLSGTRIERSAALEGYLRDLIHHTAERSDLVRVHLTTTLSVLAGSMESKLMLPAGSLSGFFEEWASRLDRTNTTPGSLSLFREALLAFSDLASDPSSVERKVTLEGLKAYVAEHFRSPLTSGRAAQRLGISRATLHRHMRRWMGLTFHEYLRTFRVNEGKRLLRDSRYSVSRVAQECGFTSSGYFIRVFKAATRTTPQQFRRGQGHPSRD